MPNLKNEPAKRPGLSTLPSLDQFLLQMWCLLCCKSRCLKCRQYLLSCTVKMLRYFNLASACILSHPADLSSRICPAWTTSMNNDESSYFRTGPQNKQNLNWSDPRLRLINPYPSDRRLQSFPLIGWVNHRVISSPEQQIDGSSYCIYEVKQERLQWTVQKNSFSLSSEMRYDFVWLCIRVWFILLECI